jgi:hypothetical protein
LAHAGNAESQKSQPSVVIAFLNQNENSDTKPCSAFFAIKGYTTIDQHGLVVFATYMLLNSAGSHTCGTLSAHSKLVAGTRHAPRCALIRCTGPVTPDEVTLATNVNPACIWEM